MTEEQEVELSMKIADVVGDAFECGKEFKNMTSKYAKLLSKSLSSQQALEDYVRKLLEEQHEQ